MPMNFTAAIEGLLSATVILVLSPIPLLVLQTASRTIADMAHHESLQALKPVLSGVSSILKKVGFTPTAKIGLNHTLLMAVLVAILMLVHELTDPAEGAAEDGKRQKLVVKRRATKKD